MEHATHPEFKIPDGFRVLQPGEIVAKTDLTILKTAMDFSEARKTDLMNITVRPEYFHWYIRPAPKAEQPGKDAKQILAEAVTKAFQTFADFERANRILGREALADAARIAKDAMEDALIEAEVTHG